MKNVNIITQKNNYRKGRNMKTLINKVKIITPDEILSGFGVVIESGKILSIIDERQIKLEEYNNIINGKGYYLSPGFIDIHNHGNSGFDLMDSTREALDRIGEYHLSKGVTSYLGTVITSSNEDMVKAIENMVTYENSNIRSSLIGIHLEGPYFNLDKKGAQPEKHIKTPNMEDLMGILNLAEDKLKMVSLAPELHNSLDIVKYLKEKNIAISMAHSNATYDEAVAGIENGITIATHLFNGMREFNHREPGIIGACLTDERVYCEIIYDRFHLHDVAVEIALKMKGYDKLILVSDSMMAAGLEDGQYILGGQKVIVDDGKPRLESGSIAGSTLNLQKAVYNMVNYLGVSIPNGVKMASLNPAKAINMDEKIGSIEVGKKADLVLFDEEINIKEVYIEGKIAWQE